MCRPRRSGSPGSPASPARPASPSCWPTRRRSSSTAATRCRRAAQVDGASTSCATSPRQPPAEWIAAASLRPRRGARLRSLAAHAGRGRALSRRRRARRRHAAARSRDNPIDAIWTDRPPAPLAPVVPHPLRFAGKSAADKRAGARGGARQGRRRCGGADRARFDRLAAQHPRRRRAAHAVAAELRDRCTAMPRSISSSTGASSRPASRRISATAVRPWPSPQRFGAALDRLGGGRHSASRPIPQQRAAWVFDRLWPRAARDPPRRRSLPIAQGVQEPGRARRHARRASARRRGA